MYGKKWKLLLLFINVLFIYLLNLTIIYLFIKIDYLFIYLFCLFLFSEINAALDLQTGWSIQRNELKLPGQFYLISCRGSKGGRNENMFKPSRSHDYMAVTPI